MLNRQRCLARMFSLLYDKIKIVQTLAYQWEAEWSIPSDMQMIKKG